MSLVITEAEWLESVRRTDEHVARLTIPNGWLDRSPDRDDPQFGGQRAWVHRDQRSVIVSAGLHDGGWWLHCSVARPRYTPSYADLADLKRVFVGDDLEAIQIFPRRERHVNIHPYALHLWARLDAAIGLPDFGAEGTI